jgi:hypothetical protein
LALSFGALTAHADTLFQVVVNTSSIAGTTGYLDFQFDPGVPTNSQSATLKIQNFTGATYVAGSQVDTGSATGGPLPSAITLTNSTDYNDDYESVKFGNLMSFTLDFGGAAINSPNGTSTSGSSFSFEISDANGNPLLTNDPNAYDATVNVNLNGSTTAVAESPQVVFTPEPASLWMMTGALALFGARYARRSK